jgi:hypothetical protein
MDVHADHGRGLLSGGDQTLIWHSQHASVNNRSHRLIVFAAKKLQRIGSSRIDAGMRIRTSWLRSRD